MRQNAESCYRALVVQYDPKSCDWDRASFQGILLVEKIGAFSSQVVP